jgi:hypothetical protein
MNKDWIGKDVERWGEGGIKFHIHTKQEVK